MNTLITPGPDRGTNKLYGRDAGGFQGLFQAQIKIRSINTDEHIWRVAQATLFGVLENSPEPGQLLQGINIAKHTQCSHIVPLLLTGLLQSRTTNTRK